MLNKLNYAKMIFFLLLIKLITIFYRKDNIHRFQKAMMSFIIGFKSNKTSQKLKDFLYPEITHKAWYEPDDYDVLQLVNYTLIKGFEDIENEWLNHLSSNQKVVSLLSASEAYSHLKDEDWQGYQLRFGGKFTQTGLALFPKTVKILHKLEPFLYANGLVELIVMKPSVYIPPHKDDMNTSLTCHLGIKLPENCGLKVGGETRNLKKGNILFFDNSFEHEAWNYSQEERVILLLELYHPELTNIEKILLQFILTV
ncbi:aspartyl/asparaginyl beta-hydroxylase domain-containing protein [Nostoc sp.]|uniref:aspartyl/asparaginyl beta-hydroxylase domain-containing protein n=1 Tax=Nostoc sp. TaxID=1180 RepID=UPI002FF65926